MRFAADHRPGSHQVHGGLVRIDEVVALDEYRNVAGDDPVAVFGEFVVVDADDIVVRIGSAAHCPESGILVVRELVIGDRRIVARCAEAYTQAVFQEVAVLQQRIAGIVGNLHADVAGLDGRARKSKVHRANQNGGPRDNF